MTRRRNLKVGLLFLSSLSIILILFTNSRFQSNYVFLRSKVTESFEVQPVHSQTSWSQPTTAVPLYSSTKSLATHKPMNSSSSSQLITLATIDAPKITIDYITFRNATSTTKSSKISQTKFNQATCQDSYPYGTQKWCFDENLRPRYFDENKKPKLIWDIDSTRTCLNNKHIVFIGDSRVRYPYLDFIYFLTFGNFTNCVHPFVPFQNLSFNYESEAIAYKDACCFSNEGCFRNYQVFFDFPRLVFNKYKALHSREYCDCLRKRWDLPKLHYIYENRFFQLTLPGISLRLSYFQNFLDSVRLNRTIIAREFNISKILLKNSTTQVTYHKTTEALEQIVLNINPTHVFLNTGWLERDISCLIKNFTDTKLHASNIIYIRNPWKLKNSYKEPLPGKKINLTCNKIPVFDRFEITRNLNESAFWDDLHVLTPVNEEFIHQMLTIICPEMV